MGKARRSGSSAGSLPPRRDRATRFLKARENVVVQDWLFDKSKKILYFGANPPGTAPLELHDEARAIKAELRAARYRSLDLVTCFASTADELIRELREAKPVIAHLGGHICKAGPYRRLDAQSGVRDIVGPDLDPACAEGLVLYGLDGQLHVVSFELVRKMFELAGASVKLVVLSACASEPLAKLLLAHVDCSIGMEGAITDATAVAFSRGFYAAVGDGASVAQAYEAGRVAVECARAPGADRIKLHVRAGVDASQIMLASTTLDAEPAARPAGTRSPRPSKSRAQRSTLRRRGKLAARATASEPRRKRARGGRRTG